MFTYRTRQQCFPYLSQCLWYEACAKLPKYTVYGRNKLNIPCTHVDAALDDLTASEDPNVTKQIYYRLSIDAT